MKSKKRVSKMIILMMVLAIGYTIPVLASNYTDTSFTFYFRSFSDGRSYTELREKQDDTSVYMKCNSTSYGYTAHVVGAKDIFGTLYDASGGHYYTFHTGTVQKMINYVYENGLSYAGIVAYRNYATDFTATGLWSPDSI